MQHTYVHKDIGEYEEKIVGKLSARMLACIAAGLAASVGSAALCHFGLGIPVANASFPVMAASMPFWLAGFWKPKGMRPEQFLPLAWRHATSSGKLAYRPAIALAEKDSRIAEQPATKHKKLRKRIRKVGEGYEPTAHIETR